MTDFANALSAGLKAAARIEQEKQEISSVVEEASSQVLAFTTGSISLEVRKFVRRPKTALVTALTISSGLVSSGLEDDEEYDALAFVLSKGGRRIVKEVAQWDSARGGYPVKIRHAGAETSCYDKGGLSQGVAEVLSSPITGAKFNSLLKEAGIELSGGVADLET